MIIKQLSIFLENRAGRLTEVTKILSDSQINISALSIAETSDYGILRLIVDQPQKALVALKENNLSVHFTDVIGIVTPDTPGALYTVLDHLSEKHISVSYMYGYSHGKKASIIMKTDNPEAAIAALKTIEVELLKANEFYEI